MRDTYADEDVRQCKFSWDTYVCVYYSNIRVPICARRHWSYLTPYEAQTDDKHKVKDSQLCSLYAPPSPCLHPPCLSFSFSQGLQLTAQQANKVTTLTNKLQSSPVRYTMVLTRAGVLVLVYSQSHLLVFTLCTRS